MTNDKTTQWIAESLEKNLGIDHETGEIPNVQILSWEWETCPISDNHIAIHIVAVAWNDPEPFKARYTSSHGWDIEGDEMPEYID